MRISFFYPSTIHYCVKDSSGWDIMDHCARSLGWHANNFIFNVGNLIKT